jgi:hypothetical protein
MLTETGVIVLRKRKSVRFVDIHVLLLLLPNLDPCPDAQQLAWQITCCSVASAAAAAAAAAAAVVAPADISVQTWRYEGWVLSLQCCVQQQTSSSCCFAFLPS